MTTVPSIPDFEAGNIVSGNDLNSVASAVSFFMGGKPRFSLAFGGVPSFAISVGSLGPVPWFNTTPYFFDNDSGWSSSAADRYTVQTPGYWLTDWVISVGTGATWLAACLQVTTSASNPFNPSTTLQYQFGSRAQSGSTVAVSGGGLIPIYLVAGDYLQVDAQAGTAANASFSPRSQFTGEWVSA
jgi:hypothetical protein